MVWDIIKNEIHIYLSEIKSKNSLSAEENAVLTTVEIYACKHLIGAKTTKIAALKSILNANSEICRTGIYAFLPIFTIIHNFCMTELRKQEGKNLQHVVVLNNANKNSLSSKKNNNISVLIIAPIVVLVLISFFSLLSEDRRKRREQEFKEILQKEKDEPIKQTSISREAERVDQNTFIQTVEEKGKDKKNTVPKISPIKIKTIDYVETYFTTGDAPYKAFFGNGIYDYSSLSEIQVINYSSSDAVVLLEHSNKGIIRNVYIKKGFTYTIKNIPEGSCIVKVMYGNSWNKEKDNGSSFPKGGFMKDIRFEKTMWDDPFVFTFTENSEGVSYPTYSLTLHKVKKGNLATERIDEDDFWH